MLIGIADNVGDSVAHLARSAKRMDVIAAGRHAALSAQDAVDAFGHAHSQSLHRARQFGLVLDFDDQMKMRRLNRKLHDAPKPRIRSTNLGHNGAREDLFAHAGESPREARGDMHRMATGKWCSSHVRRARVRRLFLAGTRRAPPRFRAGAKARDNCRIAHLNLAHIATIANSVLAIRNGI